MAQLLIIEDELVLAKNMARFFERQGHDVAVAHDGPQGLALAREVMPDVVVVDFQLPGMDGVEVIKALRQLDEQMRIVMVTGHGTVAVAVEAMKAGSMDILTKPVTLESLREVVERAVSQRNERRTLTYYKERDKLGIGLDNLVGDSPAMQQLRTLLQTLAAHEPTDRSAAPPILILGETGTGKELVARACHLAGPRASAPFVEVNCAALPSHLIEAELFGYEKGAFTDAKARKIGLFEAADGGVLFLDELAELDLTLQAKLLRVLENLRVRRLGALQDRQVNVRVVAATNQDLNALVAAGKFRSDLLYRLSVFTLQLPPLRERGNDVLLLAGFFMSQLARRYARSVPTLSLDAQAALLQHLWPGNVRELRNALERAVLLNPAGPLSPVDLGLSVLMAVPKQAVQAPVQPEAGVTLDDLERTHLLQALGQTDWNVTQAARLLGISRDTLRYRMERHRLQRASG
jgi:DNA-binding NtrC family response regulator